MSQSNRLPSESDQLGNYNYPPRPAPPAASQPCCCWSLQVRKKEVDAFLDSTSPPKVYAGIYVIGLVFYITYFACVVSQFKTISGLYLKKNYFRNGQIIFGSQLDGTQSFSNIDQCQIYSEVEQNKISNYLSKHTSTLVNTHFIVGFIGAMVCFSLIFPFFPKNEESYNPRTLTRYLLCYIFFLDNAKKYNNNSYFITRLMEKFYSGNLLLLIFTSGTAVGFSPPIFLRSVTLGDGFSCISQGDANVIDNMNTLLYALSIGVFCLYALSLIYLVTNCIQIHIIRFTSVLILTIVGVVCIVVSFVIVILYSTNLVKAFYLISLISHFLQYVSMYRVYINEKCNHSFFKEEEV
ncbi:transmembrane protein, putative (macronuclear) [Tetrahymena thermophila SB210]|uniref:Transmembrane protein, putative n=1 Tax=Tetrahymena thermophila (strain SB210) TaxID=312017 RepID=Q22DK7_TETTS|nr:transmembrane protein, putative [Tetrahymena thermophila SB210]EAR83351.2 transmembrane protein, putative [Tetrahymena thermophila SB210]|eukprot:XP_001031014.2 transmembrane protein, putative [Tetrahymena thermophila SB210]